MMNDVTQSRHFQFKKSFHFPFLLKRHHRNLENSSKIFMSAEVMSVLLDVKLKKHVYENEETVQDLIQSKK